MTEPNRFRRQVVRNTASTGLGNGWAMVVALVSVPLLLGGLGPTVFGTWVLLQTFSAITGWLSLADVGVGTATTRAIAGRAAVDDHAGSGRLVASAMALFTALGVVCAAALALAGPRWLPGLFHTPASLRDDLRVAVIVFAVQVLVDTLTEGSEACLEGLQRVDLSRAIDAVRRTLVAVATIVAAQVDHGLVAVAVASLAASAAGTLVAGGVLAGHLPARTLSPSGADIRDLLSYARKAALLRPIGVLQRTMDRLVVGATLGPAAVSLVEIATQIQSGADAVLSASAYAVVPAAAWLSARDDRRTLRELVHRGTKYSLLVTVPVATAAAILAGPAIRLWVGPQYQEAAGLAAVALASIVIAAPLVVGSNVLVGVGRATDILLPAGLTIVINLALSIVLVHVVGIVGPFQATVVACGVQAPLLLRPLLRVTGSTASDFVRDAVWPVVLPTAALALAAGLVVILPLPDVVTLLVGGVAGLAAYAAVAVRYSVDRSELQELRNLSRRRNLDET